MKRILSALLAAALLTVPARAAEPTRLAALTFDDGPSALTPELIAILAEYDVPATFFLCGYRLDQYPAELLNDPAYELGIHGDSHDYMHRMTPEVLTEELAATRRKIIDAAGREPTLLRPPGGLLSDGVREEAARQGLPIILWSVDPEDWRQGNTAAAVREAVLSGVSDGDIVLLHDLDRRTLEALPGIIEGMRERGFSFCTVSELAARRGAVLEPGKQYSRITQKTDDKCAFSVVE